MKRDWMECAIHVCQNIEMGHCQKKKNTIIIENVISDPIAIAFY